MPNKTLNIWRREYPDLLYANLYGPTEITDVCSYYIVDREFSDEEPLPIGKACENTELLVLNDDNKLVAGDEIGELCVRGICLSKGYLGDYEKTDTAFVQNPLNTRYYEKIYRTGDLVKYNDYGELIFVGRKDSQIKHLGYRIELGEIESAAYSIKEISQCCALYDSDKSVIMLIYTLNCPAEKRVIFKQLKEKIPKYMLPSELYSLDKMPYNANGKIDRKALMTLVKNNEIQ